MAAVTSCENTLYRIGFNFDIKTLYGVVRHAYDCVYTHVVNVYKRLSTSRLVKHLDGPRITS